MEPFESGGPSRSATCAQRDWLLSARTAGSSQPVPTQTSASSTGTGGERAELEVDVARVAVALGAAEKVGLEPGRHRLLAGVGDGDQVQLAGSERAGAFLRAGRRGGSDESGEDEDSIHGHLASRTLEAADLPFGSQPSPAAS